MNDKDFIYLDWNSTAPIYPSVKKEMQKAFDVFGNPSSVHLQGRMAKRLVEESRNVICELLGIETGSLFFTSGATEAAEIVLGNRKYKSSRIEHPAISRLTDNCLKIDSNFQILTQSEEDCTVQLANSETGIIQNNLGAVYLTDATQYYPKCEFKFEDIKAKTAIISPHKFGGPKGIGAILVKEAVDEISIKYSDGQESGIRPGTENVIGIVGFAEAVKIATAHRLEGVWERVKSLQSCLEKEIKIQSPDSIIVGEHVKRLPNTSCIITPSWSGEKQVIAMDLAGFGVSFGSACSNAVSKPSAAISELGFGENLANCAVRVSLGPGSTEVQIEKFVEAWSRNLVVQDINTSQQNLRSVHGY